ncbi:MAG: glycosyltransferase, partial [Bacteroidales bacterium]
MKPLFSIITVTYNAGNLLIPTMDSISAQTYKDYEYIIVDGCSKDHTLSLIESRKREITTFLSEPDKGIYDAMNKALRLATGEYILFMNAGDTLHSADTLSR